MELLRRLKMLYLGGPRFIYESRSVKRNFFIDILRYASAGQPTYMILNWKYKLGWGMLDEMSGEPFSQERIEQAKKEGMDVIKVEKIF